ncbi:MAG: DNA/RNA nuclease SfsA [Eubacteriales bacterium]|jgi:sugar fermentation stimulation protein A
MKYENTVHAIFIERVNRFIGLVNLKGEIVTTHIKNTGRCKELLIPGVEVVLAKSPNPARKTLYDLVAVYKTGLGWVNIDSMAPNAAVFEWLSGPKSLFKGITRLKPEYTHGSSRTDFYLECGERKILIEVKGCTLEVDKMGYFPDAPTSRGVKHLHDLAAAAGEGYECYIAFVIQMPHIKKVLPNIKTHPMFGVALDEAVKAGVKVLYLPCEVSPNELVISEAILDS